MKECLQHFPRVHLAALGFVATLLSSASCTRPNPFYLCGDEQRCQVLSKATLKSATEAKEDTVLEAKDEIVIRHGHACAEADQKPGEDQVEVVRLAGASTLPAFVKQATVVLNGWHVTRKDGSDLQAAGFGTLIANVALAGSSLTWDAVGAFGDEYFDDEYTWCYHYTIVGWDDGVIDAQSVESPDPTCVDYKDPVAGLFSRPQTLSVPAIAGKPKVAVLPRGFALIRDHQHLLQVAYNLDHGEPLVWYGPRPQATSQPDSVVDTGFVSWESKAIFQDQSPGGALCLGDATALVAGSGVGVLQPPFSILPDELPSGGCISSGQLGKHTRELVVTNVPFEFAVPMLTGWSLGYQCGDENVAEVGAWVESFSWNKSGSGPGTLRVQVAAILRDEDSADHWTEKMRLSILGFDAKPGLPDLVVLEQNPQYCTRNMQKELLVRVRNDGKGAVPTGTMAHVTFAVLGKTQSVDALIPGPIAPGTSSVAVPVPMPGRCFAPACPFTIEADYGNLVPEENEGNNLVSGLCPR